MNAASEPFSAIIIETGVYFVENFELGGVQLHISAGVKSRDRNRYYVRYPCQLLKSEDFRTASPLLSSLPHTYTYFYTVDSSEVDSAVQRSLYRSYKISRHACHCSGSLPRLPGLISSTISPTGTATQRANTSVAFAVAAARLLASRSPVYSISWGNI